MKQFLLVVVILVGIGAMSHAAEKVEQPLAKKLADQNMTQGLTSETPGGVPGLNYQGGVAGYAGPTRPSDKAEPVAGTPTQTLNPADIANQQQEIFRKVIEKLTDDRPSAIQDQKSQSPQKAPRKNQTAPQAKQQSQTAPGDLNMACSAKGLGVDYVTGNCVSPQGRQVNPHNLYPPFAAPLSKPEASELISRCGAQGRAADFVTGRCM